MPDLMKSHSVVSDMKYAHRHIVGHDFPNMLQYPEIYTWKTYVVMCAEHEQMLQKGCRRLCYSMLQINTGICISNDEILIQ